MQRDYIHAHTIHRGINAYTPCKPGDPRWWFLMWLDPNPYDQHEPAALVWARRVTEPRRCKKLP